MRTTVHYSYELSLSHLKKMKTQFHENHSYLLIATICGFVTDSQHKIIIILYLFCVSFLNVS